jgi:hypothetical protein
MLLTGIYGITAEDVVLRVDGGVGCASAVIRCRVEMQ